jgi:hypothetical protein
MADEVNLDKLIDEFPVNVGDEGIRPVAMSRELAELIASIACEKKGGVWKCKTKWFFFRVCSCTEKKKAATD